VETALKMLWFSTSIKEQRLSICRDEPLTLDKTKVLDCEKPGASRLATTEFWQFTALGLREKISTAAIKEIRLIFLSIGTIQPFNKIRQPHGTYPMQFRNAFQAIPFKSET